MACRILVLQPGIEPMPPAVKVQSLNHWIAREVPQSSITKHHYLLWCPARFYLGILKLKLQYFGHLMQRAHSLEKTDARKDWEQEEKGATEDEMVAWHHWLHTYDFEQIPGDSEAWGAAVHVVTKIQIRLNMNDNKVSWHFVMVLLKVLIMINQLLFKALSPFNPFPYSHQIHYFKIWLCK